MVYGSISEVYRVFFWLGGIIYGNWRKFQIWDANIKLKGIFQSVIHFPAIILYHCNLIVPFFL